MQHVLLQFLMFPDLPRIHCFCPYFVLPTYLLVQTTCSVLPVEYSFHFDYYLRFGAYYLVIQTHLLVLEFLLSSI